MIVKCEQCQTRFKIPDEKVSEKGVKVRCTKCQHTFRVTRPAAAAPVDDPFAGFAASREPASGEATRPVYFPQGVAATRLPSGQFPPNQWNAADTQVDDDIFREPTRIGPLPTGLESPPQHGALFDDLLGSEPVPDVREDARDPRGAARRRVPARRPASARRRR